MMKMSEESIIEELLAENRMLRDMKGEDLGEEEIHTLSNFSFEELANKLKISGILIAPGVWNGVLYSEGELKKMFDKYKDFLKKRMIYRVEHEKDQEFQSDKVGKMNKIKWDDGLKSILYEATIDDERAIEDIKSGRFRATSLKSKMIKVNQGGMTKGIDITPIDNSLTESPACDPCRITHFQELSEGSDSLIFYGVFDKERIVNLLKGENNGESDQIMTEIKIEELSVLVLPKETEEEAELRVEEIELEYMPINQAVSEKRIIYKFLQPGTYPEGMNKVRREKKYNYFDVKSEEEKQDESDKGDELSLKVEKTGENEWSVMDYSGDQPHSLKSFPTPEAATEYMDDLLKKGIKDKKMLVDQNKDKDMSEEELRRKRCSYCGELHDDLEAHLSDCGIRKEVVENVMKCKFCEKEFSDEKTLTAHLTECPKYKDKYGKKKDEEQSLSGDDKKDDDEGEGEGEGSGDDSGEGDKKEGESSKEDESTDEKKTPDKKEGDTDEKEGKDKDKQEGEEKKETPGKTGAEGDESDEEEEKKEDESEPFDESKFLEDHTKEIESALDTVATLLVEVEKQKGKW